LGRWQNLSTSPFAAAPVIASDDRHASRAIFEGLRGDKKVKGVRIRGRPEVSDF
jgi:hypothetical protein